MSNVLKKSGKEIHASWAKDLAGNQSASKGRISANELEQQTGEFIKLLTVVSACDRGRHFVGRVQTGSRFPRRRFPIACRAGLLLR